MVTFHSILYHPTISMNGKVPMPDRDNRCKCNHHVVDPGKKRCCPLERANETFCSSRSVVTDGTRMVSFVMIIVPMARRDNHEMVTSHRRQHAMANKPNRQEVKATTITATINKSVVILDNASNAIKIPNRKVQCLSLSLSPNDLLIGSAFHFRNAIDQHQ